MKLKSSKTHQGTVEKQSHQAGLAMEALSFCSSPTILRYHFDPL